MKKFLSLLLILCMVVPMLAACGNETPGKDTDLTVQPGKTEVIPETGLKLTENGVSEYVIVRGENASPSEANAANELQAYLQKISGAEIPVVIDTASTPTDKEIIVGKTNRETEGEFDRQTYNEDGFVIKTVGDKLYIVGTEERGTLYGVYEFLEAYLGCRFYTVDVEKIPEIKNISIAPIEEDKQVPVVTYRDVCWQDYRESPVICAKRKVYLTAGSGKREVDPAWGEAKGWVGGTDNVSRLITPAEYYEAHPEYFALVDGVRMKEGAGGGPQLCLSNPEVQALLTEKVAQKLREGMLKWGMYTVTQMDNINYCQCDNCMEVYKEEGGALSGTLLRAVNYVATSLKDEFPDIRILTLAYNYTSSAPTLTKPADNVVIMKTVAKCASHDVNAECANVYTGTPSNLDGTANSFQQDLADWGEICDQIYVYDYHMNYMDLPCTFPDFHSLYNDIQFYVNNGAFGIYSQGNYKARSTEFGELRGYLLTKLMWNPYMTEEEYWGHMDDFLEGVYGPGWTYIKEYIELAERVTEDHCFAGQDEVTLYYPMPKITAHDKDSYPEELTVESFLNYHDVDWAKYLNWFEDYEENPITAEGIELFRKAMELAETDEQRREIDKASVQVEWLKAYYLYYKCSVRNKMISLYTNFIKANPEAEEQISEELFLELNTVLYEAGAQAKQQYKEYSLALIEKMKKYTEYYNEFIQLSRSDEYNFNTYPRYWMWPGQ